MILMENVRKVYESSNSVALDGIDLTIKDGEFVFLVGPSGSGKTTIMKLITGEIRPTSGTIVVNDFDMSTIKRRKLPKARRTLGVVFQDFQLLMDRSVRENLEFVLDCTGWKDSAEREERISKVLKDVGMSTKAHKLPFQLSGGEQQRIAIARALLNSPEVILADEPTGNLDSDTAEGIMKLLTDINANKGTAIVMVTHNSKIVQDYPGRVFVCGDEKCVEVSGQMKP